MVSRRGGRPAWLPALLLWFPMLVLGAWLMSGIDVESRELRGDQHSMRVDVPPVHEWLVHSVWGWVGLGALVMGAGLLALYIWSPDPMAWRFVVTEFPAYRSAAWIFTFLGLLSWWDLHSHVVESAAGGLQWRFIAGVRAGAWNQVLTGVFFVAAAACTVAAYGAAWRLMAWPPTHGHDGTDGGD